MLLLLAGSWFCEELVVGAFNNGKSSSLWLRMPVSLTSRLREPGTMDKFVDSGTMACAIERFVLGFKTSWMVSMVLSSMGRRA